MLWLWASCDPPESCGAPYTVMLSSPLEHPTLGLGLKPFLSQAEHPTQNMFEVEAEVDALVQGGSLQ